MGWGQLGRGEVGEKPGKDSGQEWGVGGGGAGQGARWESCTCSSSVSSYVSWRNSPKSETYLWGKRKRKVWGIKIIQQILENVSLLFFLTFFFFGFYNFLESVFKVIFLLFSFGKRNLFPPP